MPIPANFRIEDIVKPPVIEAIIEMRFPAPEEGLSNTAFENIAGVFRDRFPISKKLMRAKAIINFNNQSPSQHNISHDSQQTGLQLQSAEDGNYQKIFFQADKLLVSNVGEYCGGTELIALFENAWNSYMAEFEPREGNRLAMRYINRLYYTPEELGEKLTVLPFLPELDEPVFLNDVLYSYSIADTELLNKANLNYFFKSIENNEDDRKELVEVVIDIDAYQDSGSIPMRWEIIAKKLKEVRNFKNYFFLKSFTQTGMEDFI